MVAAQAAQVRAQEEARRAQEPQATEIGRLTALSESFRQRAEAAKEMKQTHLAELMRVQNQRTNAMAQVVQPRVEAEQARQRKAAMDAKIKKAGEGKAATMKERLLNFII